MIVSSRTVTYWWILGFRFMIIVGLLLTVSINAVKAVESTTGIASESRTSTAATTVLSVSELLPVIGTGGTKVHSTTAHHTFAVFVSKRKRRNTLVPNDNEEEANLEVDVAAPALLPNIVTNNDMSRMFSKFLSIPRGGRLGSLSSSPSSMSRASTARTMTSRSIMSQSSSSFSNKITKLQNYHGWKLWKYILSVTNNQSTSHIYRKSLEEQVLLLERQLQQAQMEVAQLRKQQKQQQAASIKKSKIDTTTSTTTTREELLRLEREKVKVQQLNQRIQLLLSEIQQLETFKSELEQLLETTIQKMQELETKLVEQEEMLTQEMQQRYQQQLESLQEELEGRQQEQITKLEEMYQRRIQQAVDAALCHQRELLEEQFADTKHEMERKHAIELQAERDKFKQLILMEKQKLRQLVQALALREKKLRHKQRQQQQQS